jgi:hypothetical protein
MGNQHDAKRFFLTVILAASYLPLLAMLLNVQVDSELRKENRTLAPLPAFSWSRVADATYFTHFENYFNDHFGFRDWIIYHKHSFDESVLHRVRPDLILGRDGYLFYKFITELYVPALFANYPREYMVAVLMALHDELAQRGITMMIAHYPNKELIYHDKLPSYWRIETDPARLPFYQGLEEIQRRGVPVLSFARDFMALRETEEVFTPAEENHCSPQAYFHSLRCILRSLGEIAKVHVELPADFPKVYSEKMENGKGYRNAHRLNTAYEQSIPWTTIEDDGPGRGGRYLFRNPLGILPSTTVFTDSFFEHLAGEFGPALLPHFRELRMDYTTFSPESITPQTRVVMLVFSDQSVETHVHRYKMMLDRMKGERPVSTTTARASSGGT